MGIKKVEYDSYECEGNDDIVCPYCGFKNSAEDLDEYSEGEDFEYECAECEKVFMAHPHYSVSYDSEPFENYAADKIERMDKNIKYYSGLPINDEYMDNIKEMLLNDLMDFETYAMRILKGGKKWNC